MSEEKRFLDVPPFLRRDQAEAERSKNPFVTGSINGQSFGHTSAADRLQAVKSFSVRQCIDAIENVPGLQKTVRAAIRRRMEMNRRNNG